MNNINTKEKFKNKLRRRKTVEDVPFYKNKLNLSNISNTTNISNIKISNKNFCFSPKFKKSSNNNLFASNNFKKRLILKHFSLNNINNSYKKIFPKMNNNIEKKNLHRKSVEIMEAKAKKFFRMYSLEDVENIKEILNNNFKYYPNSLNYTP